MKLTTDARGQLDLLLLTVAKTRRVQQVFLLSVEADERIRVWRHAIVAAGGSRQPATVRQLRREKLHLGKDRVAVVLQAVLVAIALLDAVLVLIGKVWLWWRNVRPGQDELRSVRA